MKYDKDAFLGGLLLRPMQCRDPAAAESLVHDLATALRCAIKEAETLREENRVLKSVEHAKAGRESERLRERIESLERQAAEFARARQVDPIEMKENP